MPNSLTGRNFDLTSDVRSYVERKVDRLRRVFENIQKIDVVLGQDKRFNHADLIVEASHATLKCTAKDANPLAAFDVALDKMERQLARHKARLMGNRKHPRHPARREAALASAAVEPVPEELAAIFDRIAQEEPKLPDARPIKMRRMATHEAWELFEQSDYELIVFLDEESQQPHILYRGGTGETHMLRVVGEE